jgi:hypothetical protein
VPSHGLTIVRDAEKLGPALLAVLLTAQARRDDQAALDALMDTGELPTALNAGPR